MLEKAEDPIDVRIADAAVAQATRSRWSRLRKPAEVRGSARVAVTDPLIRPVDRWDTTDQCDSTLHHIVCHRNDVPAKVVRAAVLARLWSLAQGDSRASIPVLSTLTAMLGTRFAPAVPMPTARFRDADLDHISFTHIARTLRGEGHAFVGDKRIPATEGLHSVGLTAATFDDWDEHVLVSGISLTAAAAGLALASVRRSHTIATSLTALLMDVLGYGMNFPAPEMLGLIGHPPVAAVIVRIGEMLADALPTETAAAPVPYGIFCSPDLLGAAGESIRQAAGLVDDDLNGVSANQMSVLEQGEVGHDGPFLRPRTACATDLLNSGTALMGNLAQLQLDLLVDPHHTNSSPTELATEPEQQHRQLELKALATTISAAIRRASVPESLQSSPAHIPDQDASPFGVHPALNALDFAASLRLLHGMLAVTLRQAVHTSGQRPTAPACTEIMDQLIELLPPLDPHRPLLVDIHNTADLLDNLAEQSQNKRHP
ncbi:aromatic amino acid lyase [Nocardia sp. 2YAB30]|uniref:aromatic amino acid lyase n=1 Tax=Nocardia sp. 2YAB30 TaxID=3233022 RepID=UPI003F98CA09